MDHTQYKYKIRIGITYSTGWGCGSVAAFCEYGDETSGSIQADISLSAKQVLKYQRWLYTMGVKTGGLNILEEVFWVYKNIPIGREDAGIVSYWMMWYLTTLY